MKADRGFLNGHTKGCGYARQIIPGSHNSEDIGGIDVHLIEKFENLIERVLWKPVFMPDAGKPLLLVVTEGKYSILSGDLHESCGRIMPAWANS
jgi:hypothetical protein